MSDDRFTRGTDTPEPPVPLAHHMTMEATVILVNRGHGWELAEPAVLRPDPDTLVCTYGMHADPRMKPSRDVCDLTKERMRGHPAPSRLATAAAFQRAAELPPGPAPIAGN